MLLLTLLRTAPHIEKSHPFANDISCQQVLRIRDDREPTLRHYLRARVVMGQYHPNERLSYAGRFREHSLSPNIDYAKPNALYTTFE